MSEEQEPRAARGFERRVPDPQAHAGGEGERIEAIRPRSKAVPPVEGDFKPWKRAAPSEPEEPGSP